MTGKTVDISAIDKAPVDPKPVDFTADESEELRKKYFDALEKLSAATLENNRLQGVNETEEVKAGMMEQYEKNVFLYLVGYSLLQPALVLPFTFKPYPFFVMPKLVMAALVGSTAVSAIGLVRYVIIGIFGIAPTKK